MRSSHAAVLTKGRQAPQHQQRLAPSRRRATRRASQRAPTTRAAHEAGLPTAVITGASAGIGRTTALRLAEKGYNVFAGVRSAAAGDDVAALHPRIVPLFLDVCSDGDVRDAARTVAAELKPGPGAAAGSGFPAIAALVNNAGVAITGPLEFAPMSDVEQQFQVNFFGAVRVTQAFLPLLRGNAAAPGRIVNVSSVAGDVALPFWGSYCASKFALEAASDSLRTELAPQGIKVSLVKPGPVRTPTFWSRTTGHASSLRSGLSAEARALYGVDFDRYEAAYVKSSQDPTSSCSDEDVAAAIVSALTDASPRPRYYVGPTTRLLVALKRLLPTAALDAALARMPSA